MSIKKPLQWIAVFVAFLSFSPSLQAVQSKNIAGQPMPEFGKSVVFIEDGPQVTLKNLRGKAAFFIFFQSW